MRSGLLWKIVAINAAALGVVMVVVWLAVDYLAADYFAVLMERYGIAPADSNQMFLDAVHRYLVQAGALALVFAILLSLLLTRQVLRPLARMAEVTRKIAAGDLSARVEASSRDEVGRLASSFNQMADSLERIEQLRRAMVVDVAHELRTPLTTIRGYLEALADGVVPPSKDTLDLLQKETLRLVRLVEDLHQLTQAAAAGSYLRRETLMLPGLVDQAIAFQRHRFEGRGITVSVRIDADARQITGDRDRLVQVMRNLVQNAWQYGSRGGRFEITGRRSTQGVVVTFANTGPAIPEADLPLLFERFHRGDKSRSRDRGGAGIGLAIVKEIVEAHGGRVGAQSSRGTNAFWITLPA